MTLTPTPSTGPSASKRTPMPPCVPLLRVVYGGLIRALRNRQGRTLTDVAGRAGVSVAYLSEIERGLKEASSEVLEAVCTALGSSVVHLVGGAHRELLRDPAELVGEGPGARVLDLTQRHPARALATGAVEGGPTQNACLLAG